MKHSILLIFSVFIIFSCKDEINVSLQKGNGSISGQVLPANASAYVELYQGTLQTTVNCDASGYFRIDDVKPGVYRIEAKAEGYGLRRVNSIKVEDNEGYDAGIIELDQMPYPLNYFNPFSNFAVDPDIRSNNSSYTYFRFSKEMDEESVKSAISFSPELKNMKITSSGSELFYIYGDYALNTEYQFTLSTEAATKYGESLEFDFKYSFNTAPLMVGFNSSGSSNNRTNVYIYFNSAIDLNTVNNYLDISPVVSVYTDYNSSSGTSFIVRPIYFWAVDTTMLFTIKAGLTDNYGNELPADTTFSFKTPALSITQTTPLNGQTFVDVSSQIGFQVNYSLDETSILAALSVSPDFNYSVENSTQVFRIIPDTLLSPNTEYIITLDTKLKSLYGGNLKQPYTLKFKTK